MPLILPNDPNLARRQSYYYRRRSNPSYARWIGLGISLFIIVLFIFLYMILWRRAIRGHRPYRGTAWMIPAGRLNNNRNNNNNNRDKHELPTYRPDSGTGEARPPPYGQSSYRGSPYLSPQVQRPQQAHTTAAGGNGYLSPGQETGTHFPPPQGPPPQGGNAGDTGEYFPPPQGPPPRY